MAVFNRQKTAVNGRFTGVMGVAASLTIATQRVQLSAFFLSPFDLVLYHSGGLHLMRWLVVGAVVCALCCHFVIVVESQILKVGPHVLCSMGMV